MSFSLLKTDTHSKARAGELTLPHGAVQTPIFMPVGTAGSVKGVTQQQLKQDVKAQIILGNTYHLYLRPGTEVLEAAGGLHRFMGWDGPVLTDSGGYQVFSLAANRKLKEEGALFQSHIDGSRHLFTPEKVMDIQRAIGADIIMAFDECPPYPSEYGYAKKSMEMTHRWLSRCIAHKAQSEPLYGYEQLLFPIVQGSTYKDLRAASCDYISAQNAPGNAIGGLSVGEPEGEMYELTQFCCERLPEEQPRYLMGVGTPWNILENISYGVDMFDCVMPTRNGRNGMLFTSKGVINIKNKRWATDFTPVDEHIGSELSSYYTRAYLRHLFVANELLGMQLASLHNISFYLWLVGEARQQILAGNYQSWKNEMIPVLKTRL